MSEVAVGMGAEAHSCHPGPLSLTQSFSLPFSSCGKLNFIRVTVLLQDVCYVFRNQNCIWNGVEVRAKCLFSDNSSFSYKQREDFLRRLLAGFPFKLNWPKQSHISTPSCRGGWEGGYLTKKNVITWLA